jgi:hypothetical protein
LGQVNLSEAAVRKIVELMVRISDAWELSSNANGLLTSFNKLLKIG